MIDFNYMVWFNVTHEVKSILHLHRNMMRKRRVHTTTTFDGFRLYRIMFITVRPKVDGRTGINCLHNDPFDVNGRNVYVRSIFKELPMCLNLRWA